MSVFGDSAFLLQKQTSSKWSFNKEERFKSARRSADISYLPAGSTLSMRSTSIGFGKKLEVKNHFGKDSPPPGAYDLPSTFNLNAGPKMINSTALPLIGTRYISPGPGSYNPYFKGNSPRYTFGIKHAQKKKMNVPSPAAYEPKYTLTEFSGNTAKFNKDLRMLNKKSADTGPGPGYYNVSY